MPHVTERGRTSPARTPRADDAAPAAPADTAPTPPDDDGPALPPASRFSGADARAAYRISVRSVAGQPTKAPALADDWFEAAYTAEAKHLANLDVQKLIDDAIATEEAQLGRPLDRDEQRALARPIHKAQFRGFYAKHYKKVAKDDASKKKAVSSAKRREKKRLEARGRDPFTPLAQGDRAARQKEVMLFEDADLMVVIDRFSPSPKALVVPKEQGMFPTDIKKATLAKLSEVSALVSDAFAQVAGSQPAEIWINPPQNLSLKQLHVHVQPRLPAWEDTPRPRGVPPPPDLVAEQQKFYAELGAKIAALIAAH